MQMMSNVSKRKCAGPDISFRQFNALLAQPVSECIIVNDNTIVRNGFSVRSDNHTYYGIVENDMIRNLCLNEFDYADEELMNVLSIFNLTLIDWCNASRLIGETTETPAQESLGVERVLTVDS